MHQQSDALSAFLYPKYSDQPTNRPLRLGDGPSPSNTTSIPGSTQNRVSKRLAKPVLAEPPRRILGVVRQDRIRPRALKACHRLRSEIQATSVVDDKNVDVDMATAIWGGGGRVSAYEACHRLGRGQDSQLVLYCGAHRGRVSLTSICSRGDTGNPSDPCESTPPIEKLERVAKKDVHRHQGKLISHCKHIQTGSTTSIEGQCDAHSTAFPSTQAATPPYRTQNSTFLHPE